MTNHLISPRGHALFGRPGAHRYITCEIYSKWYELFIVDSSGSITPLTFGEIDEAVFYHYKGKITPIYVDHTPNPAAVRAFADLSNIEVNDLAMEMITGRWMIEVES